MNDSAMTRQTPTPVSFRPRRLVNDAWFPLWIAQVCTGLVLTLTGCDEPTGGGSGAPPAARSAPAPTGAAPAPRFDSVTSSQSESDDSTPLANPTPTTDVDNPAETSTGTSSATSTNRQVAETGVGKRGRNYGGGVVTEPIRQYFRASERISFIQIDKAMRDFKVLNERLPRDDAEFQAEIIEANAISLPELPEGERYVYDPQLGELMVERPKVSE